MDDIKTALTALLRRTLDGFSGIEKLERLSGGASQETYAIVIATAAGTRKLALRRAAGGALGDDVHGRPGLAVEARLITLAGRAGVPVPEIIHVLDAGDDLGEGFLMSWVGGETLGARIVRGDDFTAVRPRLARQCGDILARIHAIDIDANGLADCLQTIDPETFVRRQWQQYQSYETAQPMIDYTARWLLENLPPDPRLTLVHNDFRNGNLIVDPRAGISAVLDWELAHIGDPMRDLGWICTNSWRFGVREHEVGGFGDLDELIAGYEAAGGRKVDREAVRYWQVFGSFWWAIGCLGMAAQYRSGPDRTVERPGIGRRSSECQVDCMNLIIPGAVAPPVPSVEHDDNMPRSDELLISVRDFLRTEVAAATSGRTRFLCRVAANSLDILARERTQLANAAAADTVRLRKLLERNDDLSTLRWALVERLRDGTMALDNPALTEHLRESVVAQLAIDQPGYSGLQQALAYRGANNP